MRTVWVPTPRAALVLAMMALPAVLVAAAMPQFWPIVPVAGLMVVALVLADIGLAGRLADVRVHVPDEGEVGRDVTVTVLADLPGRPRSADAALALDPRLSAGGRATVTLARGGGDSAVWQGSLCLTPSRRGLAPAARFWLAWTGPLGLGSRQASRPLDQAVRVMPDLSPVRSPALSVFLRQSDAGQIARRLRGEGTMFEALSEYQPGMDRRRIDWKSSARHMHLYAKEYESERNNPIVFALDCGQAMCEPVAGVARLDRALSAALTTAWVALKGGDRVMLTGFAARVQLATPFVADARGFARLKRAAAQLDYCAEEPNFTLAIADLSARLQRRSLVVMFTEFTDPAGAELMIESVGRLVRRHRVLFVTFADEELESMAAAAPQTAEKLAGAVSAEALLRARELVIMRLRQMGVDVISAPHARIGTRLLDAYLAIRRQGAIG
jgi:uncharacterized protein (DUF58 family)